MITKISIMKWIKGINRKLSQKELGYTIFNRMPTLKKDMESGNISKISEKIVNIRDNGIFTEVTENVDYDSIVLYGEYDKKVGKIIMMSPMEYMKRTQKGFGVSTLKDYLSTFNSSIVADYSDKMYAGNKFPLCFLDYSRNSFVQEGRHRTYAAYILGVPKIPVLIVNDSNDYEEIDVILPDDEEWDDVVGNNEQSNDNLLTALGLDESVNFNVDNIRKIVD